MTSGWERLGPDARHTLDEARARLAQARTALAGGRTGAVSVEVGPGLGERVRLFASVPAGAVHTVRVAPLERLVNGDDRDVATSLLLAATAGGTAAAPLESLAHAVCGGLVALRVETPAALRWGALEAATEGWTRLDTDTVAIAPHAGPTALVSALREASLTGARAAVVPGLGVLSWADDVATAAAVAEAAIARLGPPGVPGSGGEHPAGLAVAWSPYLRGAVGGGTWLVGAFAASEAVRRLADTGPTNDPQSLAAALGLDRVRWVAGDDVAQPTVEGARAAVEWDDDGRPGSSAATGVLLPGLGAWVFAGDAVLARRACDRLVLRAAAVAGDAEPLDVGAIRRLAGQSRAWGSPPTADDGDPLPLRGRIALVTGAAAGIGRATARRLLDAGACVAATDLDLEGAREAVSGVHADRACALALDVRDEAAIARAVAATVQHFGGLDIAVNNAGAPHAATTMETTGADLDLQHEITNRGSFLVSQAAARVMQQQGSGGDLLYVCSRNAVYAAPENLAYSAAKAAQAHQVRLLAVELGAADIRVNAVNPSGVVTGTRLYEGAWGDARAAMHDVPKEELSTFYAQRTLLQREILPEHVAAALFALLSGDLERTTGAFIPVDGGFAAAFPR